MAVSRLDEWMGQEHSVETKDLRSTFKSRKRKRCQKPQRTMKEIVDCRQGSTTSPIFLADDGTKSSQLFNIPYKILSFREDARPPYKGTYTRAVPPASALKLSRRPFARQLPDIDYDYDSEAEWEPPNEDDEDLDSGDDESDVGEEGEEDMDGFLDDEDDLIRRKQVMGEMTPISSGLCWITTNTEMGALDEYRIQPLSDEQTFPIDPFSTAYWRNGQPSRKPSPAMQPPRLPLSNLNPNRSPSVTPPAANLEAGGEGVGRRQEPRSDTCGLTSVTKARATAITPTPVDKKPLKLAPDHMLPDLRAAIAGSNMTKAGLVEVLKKR
jgi:chromatin assembly factor 1 subunit A